MPPASDVVVTPSGGSVTVMLRLALLVTAVGVCESVTDTVKCDVLVTVPVGVPEITPALLTSDDKWILLRLDAAIRRVTSGDAGHHVTAEPFGSITEASGSGAFKLI